MIKNLCINVLMLLIIAAQLSAATPKELSGVIDHFMNMEASSLEIQQIIDWRFAGANDSITLRMDIKAGQNFHLNLPAFGMEIYVTETEMMTLNHVRAQILYENATPDALLKQIFVGGDLNRARFKGKKTLDSGLRQLDFKFDSDFSDWQSLSVILDDQDELQKLILVDYDGNRYLITLTYLPEFADFNMPDIQRDYLHYQIADLRK